MGTMLGRLIGEDVELATALGPASGMSRPIPARSNRYHEPRRQRPGRNAEWRLLAIETSEVHLTRTPMHRLKPLPAGSYLKLTVTDTGCGMDTETLSHLFEPFFTTKEESKGTGLGLSTVFGIVTKSGGGIDVWSQVGHGTTFDIFLPAINPETSAGQTHDHHQEIRRGSERILVVEDEQLVRDLVRDELTKIRATISSKPKTASKPVWSPLKKAASSTSC